MESEKNIKCENCICRQCPENQVFFKDGRCTGCNECGKENREVAVPCLITGK